MSSKPRGIAPLFLVENVVHAAEYYRDKLGFEIGPYFLDPSAFVILQRDEIALMLALAEGGRVNSNSERKDEAFDAYIWVESVDAIYETFKKCQANLLGRPDLKSYGMKEFDVRDLDGYVIRFGEDVPESPNSN
jgi:predicted lactoylglutathione lyase